MKGQSIVIQFIVFFLIGLSLLISLSQFFNYQSDLFKERGSDSAAKLVNSYISSMAVQMYDSCKQCDFINSTTRISNTTVGHYFKISFKNNHLIIQKFPGGKSYTSSLHNLNETLTLVDSYSSSVQPITLTLNKTKNYLQVS